MVAGNDQDGYAFSCKIEKIAIDLIHNHLRHPRPEEDITTVQQEIRASLSGIIQYAVEIIKEIRSPPAPFHARLDREIKTQVGIGEEDDAYVCHFCSDCQN